MTGPKKPRLLVGISGGVDSAAAAAIACRDYAVEGLYCIMSDAHLAGEEAARRAAAELAIPITVLDLRRRFLKAVIRPFAAEYAVGRTPNPCVICNPLCKFAALLGTADRLGIPYIATGHYARVGMSGGFFALFRASEAARDQSYMLYRLPQEILARLALPLGELTKREVRGIAESRGLAAAAAPDSQDICFIPDGDRAGYLAALGFRGKSGRFIAPDGSPLAPHRGVEHYTVGQRRGLGVSLGLPVFVRRILPSGDIELAFSGEHHIRQITLSDAVFNPGADFQMPLTVKLRSAGRDIPCRLSPSGGGFLLTFDAPQRAPAPGQSAVIYSGDMLLGGGIID